MRWKRLRLPARTDYLVTLGALGTALGATAACESSRPTAFEETAGAHGVLATHATLVELRVADSLGGVVLDPRPTDDTTIVLFAQDTRTRCKGLVPTIKAEPGIPTVGTSNTDVIVGTNGADRIDGRGGDDVICGLRGADVLLGGGGNDVIHGNEGTDSLFGHGGSDVLAGHGGTDLLFGGDGDDTLKGGTQPDTLFGEGGDDALAGNAGPDLLDGGAGADSLVGGGGNDALIGQGGGDRLFGGAGRDQMDGGPGADLLLGGAGPDTLFGGEGNDELFGEGDADWLDGGSDNDLLHGGPAADRLLGREGRDQLFGSGGKDTLQGGPGNDRLRGDDGNDVLRGGDGEDDLRGGDGNDTLGGQAGNDVLRGNAGTDALDGGPDQDDCGGGGQPGDTEVNCEASIAWNYPSPRWGWYTLHSAQSFMRGQQYFIGTAGSGTVDFSAVRRGATVPGQTSHQVEEGRGYRLVLEVRIYGSRSAWGSSERCATYEISSPAAPADTVLVRYAYSVWFSFPPEYWCPTSYGLPSLTVENAVASVAVSPSVATIQVGATQQFTVQMWDADNANLLDRRVAWSSSDPTVATVSSTGLATGESTGTVTITATSEDQIGTATLTVQ